MLCNALNSKSDLIIYHVFKTYNGKRLMYFIILNLKFQAAFSTHKPTKNGIADINANEN